MKFGEDPMHYHSHSLFKFRLNLFKELDLRLKIMSRKQMCTLYLIIFALCLSGYIKMKIDLKLLFSNVFVLPQKVLWRPFRSSKNLSRYHKKGLCYVKKSFATGSENIKTVNNIHLTYQWQFNIKNCELDFLFYGMKYLGAKIVTFSNLWLMSRRLTKFESILLLLIICCN